MVTGSYRWDLPQNMTDSAGSRTHDDLFSSFAPMLNQLLTTTKSWKLNKIIAPTEPNRPSYLWLVVVVLVSWVFLLPPLQRPVFHLLQIRRVQLPWPVGQHDLSTFCTFVTHMPWNELCHWLSVYGTNELSWFCCYFSLWHTGPILSLIISTFLV